MTESMNISINDMLYVSYIILTSIYFAYIYISIMKFNIKKLIYISSKYISISFALIFALILNIKNIYYIVVFIIGIHATHFMIYFSNRPKILSSISLLCVFILIYSYQYHSVQIFIFLLIIFNIILTAIISKYATTDFELYNQHVSLIYIHSVAPIISIAINYIIDTNISYGLSEDYKTIILLIALWAILYISKNKSNSLNNIYRLNANAFIILTLFNAISAMEIIILNKLIYLLLPVYNIFSLKNSMKIKPKIEYKYILNTNENKNIASSIKIYMFCYIVISIGIFYHFINIINSEFFQMHQIQEIVNYLNNKKISVDMLNIQITSIILNFIIISFGITNAINNAYNTSKLSPPNELIELYLLKKTSMLLIINYFLYHIIIFIQKIFSQSSMIQLTESYNLYSSHSILFILIFFIWMLLLNLIIQDRIISN